MEKQKEKYAHTHTKLHFLKLINIFWMSSLRGLKIIYRLFLFFFLSAFSPAPPEYGIQSANKFF